jgi:hypothetical protein
LIGASFSVLKRSHIHNPGQLPLKLFVSQLVRFSTDERHQFGGQITFQYGYLLQRRIPSAAKILLLVELLCQKSK